jgi:WD40 repeat protein
MYLFRSTKSYALAARLKGHSDGIYTLAVSPSGNLLASGGKCIVTTALLDLLNFGIGGDGIKIWDLQTNQQQTRLPQSQGLRGPISCVQWLVRKDDSLDMLCYGTGLGYLVIWHRLREVRVTKCITVCKLRDRQGAFQETWAKRLATGQEITCLTTDTSHGTHTRIAVGTRDKVVQVLKINAKSELQSVFSIQLEVTVPIAIGFADNTAKDVYVLGLFNGQLWVFFHMLPIHIPLTAM